MVIEVGREDGWGIKGDGKIRFVVEWNEWRIWVVGIELVMDNIMGRVGERGER